MLFEGRWRRPVSAEDERVGGLDEEEDAAVVARRFFFEGGEYRTIAVSDLDKFARTLDLSDEPSDIDILKQVQESVGTLKLRGVPKIAKVYSEERARFVFDPLRNQKGKAFIKDSEIKLTTDGSNLLDVLAFEVCPRPPRRCHRRRGDMPPRHQQQQHQPPAACLFSIN